MTSLRRQRALNAAAAVLLGAFLLIGGCARTDPEPKPPAQPAALGACVEQLHDLSGVLLLYWNRHRQLPPSIKELEAAAQTAGIPLLCPDSGKPYLYDPQGVPGTGHIPGVVLCDSQPTHGGGRWGITVSPPPPGGVITSRIVFLPTVEP